ncbi:serine/threonine-protein phosphatase [candidate division WOR-3 bacterium]|nr:serine/threonine-protein phosphatase [candidate division WOR-3 bacterium]
MSYITLIHKTSKGSKTSRNEDFFTWVSIENQEELEKKGALFVIVDGFGGRSEAAVSSEYIAREISERYYTDETSRTTKERLTQALKESNGKFYRDWKERNDKRGVGASVSVLVVKSHSVFVANIGDSKVYLLRNRALKTVSKDYSWQAAEGEKTPRDRSMRNILMSSLGSRPVLEPEVVSLNIKQDDIFLMTTDGVTDFIDDGEIRETCLYRFSDELPGIILSSAVKSGSDDDATVALIKIHKVPVEYKDIPEKRLSISTQKSYFEEIQSEPLGQTENVGNQNAEDLANSETKNEKRQKTFNWKILLALIPFVILLLAFIINPFNFLQRENRIISSDTISAVGANEPQVDTNSGYSDDSLFKIEIVNVSNIPGVATKAQIIIAQGVDSIFDSLGPGFSYSILNGYASENFQSSLNLFSVGENSENSKKIIDLFSSIFPDSFAPVVRPLHIIIEVGDDLLNTGNFLPDSAPLENFDVDTLNVCVISRFSDDSIASRIFNSLNKSEINSIPVRVVAVIEPPDTSDKDQSRILSNPQNLRLAKSLAHAMGLRDDFYVWSDSTSRLVFLLNKNIALTIQ